MSKALYISLPLAAAIAVGGVGTALAQNTGQGDTRGELSELAALQGAKIGLAEAIDIAEKATGGKAVGGGIDNENGRYAYEVEVIGPNGKQDGLIDPTTGKVTKTAHDDDAQSTDDSEEDNGEDDD